MFLFKSFPVHFCPFKGKSRPRANFVPFLPNTGEKGENRKRREGKSRRCCLGDEFLSITVHAELDLTGRFEIKD